MALHRLRFFFSFLLIIKHFEFQNSNDCQEGIIQFLLNFLKTYSNYQKKIPNYEQLTPPMHPTLGLLVLKFLKHFLINFFSFQQY